MKKLGLFLLIAVAASAYGQTWQLVNPLPAGRADDIAIGYTTFPVEQRLYIADQTSWPFKSVNGGISWDSLRVPNFTDNPIAVVADPNNAARVWIARNGQGVFYSYNEGLNWAQRIIGLTNLNVITLEMAPDDPDVIFAGCSYSPNVFKTMNGGDQWVELSSPSSQVLDIETPGSPYQVLLAATDNGIYKSTTSGSSWSQTWNDPASDIARDPNQAGVFYAAIYTANPKVLKSTDYGDSWTEIPPPLNGFKGPPRKVAVSPSSRIYVATENAGVYWKGPDPDPWHLAGPAEGLYDKLATGIAVDGNPSAPGFLVYSTLTYVYRSTDYGASWGSSVNGMRRVNPGSFSPSLPGAIFGKGFRPDVAPSYPGYAVTVFRSTDGGAEWDLNYSSTSYEGYPRGPRTLVAHPQDALRVYLKFENPIQDIHQISSTTNGGLTWNEYGFGNGCVLEAVAVDRDPKLAYVVNEENTQSTAFLTTDDGGGTWVPKGDGIIGLPISLASYPTDSRKIFVGTTEEGVSLSNDFGETWAQVGLAGNRIAALSIDNLNHSIIYAGSQGGNPGVHKSTNEGSSWVQMNAGLTYPEVTSIESDPAEPAIVYAATREGDLPPWSGHCYVSVDGALQWSELQQIPNSWLITDLQIDYNQPDKVYAVTTDGYDPVLNQAPTPTGLYTYSPSWQFKSLTSASSNASDYNSQRKLVRQEWTSPSVLHAVYHSGGSAGHHVYYTVSTDGGNSWSPKAFLGEGKHPAIALDVFGNPHVVYLSDDDHIIYHVGNPWGGGWTEPVKIYNPGTNYTLGPPAFVTDPGFLMDRGHVIFHQLGPEPDAPHSILYGLFDPFDPGLFQPATVDGPTTEPCLRPSLGFYNGWVRSLHAVWARGNQVYYSSKVLDSPDPWTSPYQVSDQSTLNHDPNIEVYGDRAHVAWVESGVFPPQVTYRFKDLWEGWFPQERVAYLPSDYGTPQMAAGAYCVWGQGDGEVYYSNRNPYEGWGSPVNWSNTPQLSASPQVTFASWMMGTTLFCFWTEDDAAPYQEYFATTMGPLGGFFSLDAGQERASSYTVHRGGYQQYANHPEKTVDTDGSYLSYRFRRLDPRKLYLVRASYYQETGSPTGLEVKVDGATFANVMVPNRSVLRGEAWVPAELYADSVVEFVIRKKSGTLGTLGYLELCQAEPKGKGGPQSSELSDLSLPREFSLGAGYPNPMTSEARIDYALPKASSVDLTVYNISGQAVRRLVSESSKAPGRYSVRWDGRNESGHRVPCGVYFYRLKAGSFTETKKMVVVR